MDGKVSEVVILLVLISAGLHVGWNLVVRKHPGNLGFMTALTFFGGLAASLASFLLRIPMPWHALWPYLVGTVLAHALYFSGLSRVYQNGTLGEVYPATRGIGILGTAFLAWALLRQTLPMTSLVGILIIAMAVAWPALGAQWNMRGFGWVLAVGASIAVYSTIDNHGARLSSPLPYIACQFLGASLLLGLLAIRQGEAPSRLGDAALGGLASVGSYLLILFAYRLSAAAPVLALRQVGIAIAPLAGWVLLKEALPRRVLYIALGVAVGGALLVFR